MSGHDDSLRKGWCPGALRPMMAKDGLLVRLRVTGGIVPARVADALAVCAARYGNGLFDLSARGNLQMRGVGEAALEPLLAALRALALLDEDAGGEAVRNVIASPLAGCHDGLDIRPITAALEERLSGDPALHALPGKFGFLVDDGSLPSLAGVSADVRFDWQPAENRFLIVLGGSRVRALPIGFCARQDLVDRAADVAHGALRLIAANPERRRMRDLIAAHGADLVALACGGARIAVDAPPADPEPRIIGFHTFAGITTIGLGVPFGRLDAAMLRCAAACARAADGGLRLTPWRAILVPHAAAGVLGHARSAGFIVDDGDGRRAIAACTGRHGCARGTTATHADATALADAAARLGDGITVHVSGCEKGCARPASSPVTLVARDGRYDLVRDGRAADPPMQRGLGLDAVRAVLARLGRDEASRAG